MSAQCARGFDGWVAIPGNELLWTFPWTIGIDGCRLKTENWRTGSVDCAEHWKLGWILGSPVSMILYGLLPNDAFRVFH